MPFPYPTSSASVRTRRTKEKDKEKDKDSRGVASSSSGRRHREVSKSSKGTESKALSTSPLSLYSQHNITLDQLPALPESGTESPSCAASPVYPSSPYLTNAVHLPQSSVYPHTPAALQPYLDDESDEPTPLSGPSDPAVIPFFGGTDSPRPQHQSVIEEAAPPAITAPQKPAQSASPRSLSPPQLSKPSLSYQRQASPASPILHQPRPQYQNFLAHPEELSASTSQGPSVPPDLSGPSGQEVVDDPTNLLYRIQSAIPDLHLLLNRYRETTGQVSVREDMIRRTEAQMAEALWQKEAYIDKLGKELETVYQRHSAESSKFRLEIGNLEEKHKELQDNFDASKKSRDELEAANRALQSEKELSEKKLQETKAILQRDFDQWKTQTVEEFAVKQRRIEDDIQRQSNESHAVMQERIAELTKTHTKEKETLHTRLLQQLRELETNHSRLRQDLEFTRKARQKDLEEAQKKELQSRDAWDKERSAIVRERDEERLSLGKGWEEQRRILAAKHESEKDDLQSTWKSTQAQINERAEGNIARLQREIEKLKTGWDADKARFVKATTELKAVAAKLDNKNDNLQRMVEAFGEATDFRSKGDTYFIDAFTQLRKQILDLAVEHFRDLQQEPPEHVQKRIPRTIPPFYTNNEASTQLRAAYVEHVVSRALTNEYSSLPFHLSRR
ncbi:MAG: hypothetical protein FRX48_01154 [Lasallia pustulata]|uniref:Uncharacterized protein n=1 Tax=Lasallia pustulata TaxID=136370 RepID=A0A5M8PZ66_9LECA|nr:MAG: hypothetical protein FRX48_01154 [Lasallia pustulata]